MNDETLLLYHFSVTSSTKEKGFGEFMSIHVIMVVCHFHLGLF